MNVENQCNELYNNILESEYFYNKLVDLEDKSKRKNLRIDGIADGLNESCSAKSNCKIYFQKNLAWKIELVHLVKNKQNKGKKTKPTAIVCKTLSYKHKNEVLKNTKKLFINEDFCHETMQHSKDVKRQRGPISLFKL